MFIDLQIFLIEVRKLFFHSDLAFLTHLLYRHTLINEILSAKCTKTQKTATYEQQREMFLSKSSIYDPLPTRH